MCISGKIVNKVQTENWTQSENMSTFESIKNVRLCKEIQKVKREPGSLTYLSVWRLYYYMLRPIYIQLWRVFNVPSCFHLCIQRSNGRLLEHPALPMPSEGVVQAWKMLHATGMRSHDSTGPEPTLYPLGQTRQLMKGKRKNGIWSCRLRAYALSTRPNPRQFMKGLYLPYRY
jgi:hypothetical protein